MSIKISELRCQMNSIEITAKVNYKSNVNKFKSGNGQLFSVNLEDDSASIRMVFFNDLALKFFEKLNVCRNFMNYYNLYIRFYFYF